MLYILTNTDEHMKYTYEQLKRKTKDELIEMILDGSEAGNSTGAVEIYGERVRWVDSGSCSYCVFRRECHHHDTRSRGSLHRYIDKRPCNGFGVNEYGGSLYYDSTFGHFEQA